MDDLEYRGVPREVYGRVLHRPQSAVVLYAKSGALGHSIIADNYASLLSRSGYSATSMDVLAYERGRDIQVANFAYFEVLRRIPWFWRYLYSHWSSVPGVFWAKTSLLPIRFPRTCEFLIKSKPSLVITTHPVATSIVSSLKRRGLLRCPLVTAFSDWHFQPFWMYPNVDTYFVATARQARQLTDCGVAPEAIAEVGILVNGSYYAEHDRRKVREALGIPEAGAVLLVMSGGTAWRMEQFVTVACQLEMEAIVYFLGVPDVLRSRLESIVQKSSRSHLKVHILGYVDAVPYLTAADLFLTKPGGLSVAQALAVGIPTILAFPIPGHEEQNLAELAAIAPIAVLPDSGAGTFLTDLLSRAATWNQQDRETARQASRECPARVNQAISRTGCQLVQADRNSSQP